MDIRIVFMGSPEFAQPTLKALHQHFQVVGVVTQPDRPAGRGRTLTPPPIKSLADAYSIPCIQPERLRRPESFAVLESWNPDMIVVTAFGQILRQNVLELPQFGCINVHASLLPRWRGAAPIQAAILNGDTKTGVTIMKMDAGVDTGAILSQREYLIAEDDTAGSLSSRLANMGADLLIETIPDYVAGKIFPREQNEEMSTYAGMLKKEEGLLDFCKDAQVLVWQVHAFNPWPSAYFYLDGEIIKVHRAHVARGNAACGTRHVIDRFPVIGAENGWLVLDEVQPAGKKPMPGDVFLRGARQWQ